jgi:predicted O-methyltransferase YrrM
MSSFGKLFRYSNPFRIYREYRKLVLRIENLEMRLSTMAAVLDTHLDSPVVRLDSGKAFNGQEIRKRIFHQLCDTFRFDSIIETGTFTGETTGYLAAHSAGPVYTCESNDRFHTFAQSRLAGQSFSSRISFHRGESAGLLRQLSAQHSNETTFFYLDAHWYSHLPLREEIAIIVENWEHFVVMIDDFEVPGDANYGFDDYGGGQSISRRFISEVLDKYKLAIFYPSLAGSMETGARRGCAIVVRRAEAGAILESCDLLDPRGAQAPSAPVHLASLGGNAGAKIHR